MNLSLFVGHNVVPVTKTVFPAGESCIRIDKHGIYKNSPNVKITMEFRNNGDLFDLALLVDAVRREFDAKCDISLYMPYLPYARQDRVMVAGESLSIKVVADFINSLGFTTVYCEDIHSDVGVALINNLVHIKQEACAWSLPNFERPANTILVSPDAGAAKKVFAVAKKLGYNEVVTASKKRDVASGLILKTMVELPDNFWHKDFLIVDDICDGGRTFIELAKAIKKDVNYSNERICLYVTHGIFSAGLEVFDGFIDKIYVHNLMKEEYNEHPLITIV